MEDDFDLGDDLGGCEDEDDDDDECDSDYSEDSAGEERKAHSTLDWHLLYYCNRCKVSRTTIYTLWH